MLALALASGGGYLVQDPCSPDRLAVCGDDELVVSVYDGVPLSPAQLVLGEVEVDLITVKIC
jgi:hypothetical protein